MRIYKITGIFLSISLLALFVLGCKGDRTPTLTRGQVLPSVVLPMAGGGEFNIPADMKGKVNIILFWTQGCTYCEKEMPLLKPLYEKYQDKGFEFVAVHMGKGMAASEEMRSDMKLPFAMAVDKNSSLGKRYGVVAVPTMFVLGEKGVLLERILGGLPVGDIEKMVQQRIQ